MTIDTQAALAYFKVSDPIMYELLKCSLDHATPLLVPKPKPISAYFRSIISSIISQQISAKAADAVRGRVETLFGEVTPESVLRTDRTTLQACGLSHQKVKYIYYNAEYWHTIPINSFESMSDEEIIKELTALYGIGTWTAEMFLIFSLARPNVFSYGDLALVQSLYETYHYRPHYTKKIATTVAAWSPHQTTASLALWYARDKGPVLL